MRHYFRRVNEGPDDEPIVVPITRFSFGESVEEPDYDIVWELVGEGLQALQSPLKDVFVRHYDIQFTFDGDELFEAEECRRVAVTPDLVDRFVSDAGFGVDKLRNAMLEADDIAPVAWGESKNYSQMRNAAIVTNGAMMATGMSAGAATCAGTSAAGAGTAGGTCGGAGGV